MIILRGKLMHTKKIITITFFATVLIVACTVISIFLIKEKFEMNLWGDWFSQNGVRVTLTWDDPRGVQQVRTTSEVNKIVNISSSFQSITDPQKKLFLPDEARSGSIVYKICVTGEERTVLYAIERNFIIIADEKSPKCMTVWKVKPEESEGLIQTIIGNTN